MLCSQHLRQFQIQQCLKKKKKENDRYFVQFALTPLANFATDLRSPPDVPFPAHTAGHSCLFNAFYFFSRTASIRSGSVHVVIMQQSRASYGTAASVTRLSRQQWKKQNTPVVFPMPAHAVITAQPLTKQSRINECVKLHRRRSRVSATSGPSAGSRPSWPCSGVVVVVRG